MRLRLVGTLFATLALTILLDGIVRSSRTSLFASSWQLWLVWTAMTVTVGLGAATSYLVLRTGPPDFAIGGLYAVVGAAIGYAWPIAFTLGIEAPDFLTQWTTGPALVIWQALFIFVIGVAGLLRRLGSRFT